MHDREDKYEADDSEYHFSDDEVNYEVDESASAPIAEEGKAAGGGGLASIAKSRLVISLVAFFALMFVVYKMVAPGGSSSDISTDIAPQVASVPQPQAPIPAVAPTAQQQVAVAPQQAPAAAPATAQQQLAAMQETAQQQAPQQPAMQQYPQQSMQQYPQQAMPQQPVQQQVAPQQSQQPAVDPQLAAIRAQAEKDISSMMQTQTGNISQQLAPVQQQGSYPAAQTQQQISSQQQYPQQFTQQVAPQQAIPAMPGMQQAATQFDRDVEQSNIRARQLEAENARLSESMRAQYEQRIADYQSQTNSLQSEIKTLNGRVANMESEMTQLIRTLTQQFQGGSPAAGMESAQERAAPPPTVPYSVQAIIPGRAWLRSDSGDTVTVTEGDQINGVGQVTRIDPYDGVVEIDVRGKKISLSYGGGR